MGEQDKVWTIQEVLSWCEAYLQRHGDVQPRLSAQWLLSEVCGLSRIELYTNFDKPLTASERAQMREWVSRRAQGEPLQLICGKAPFRYLTLAVAPDVLIPRPETEVLVSEAFDELSLPRVSSHVEMGDEGEVVVDSTLPEVSVLDLCTGSGCIACAIASEYPTAQVIAVDVSPQACALAEHNVEALELQNRVVVWRQDLLGDMSRTHAHHFDLIISNPPYIPTATLESLDREVADYEPALALDGGEDGLGIFRRFYREAFECLRPGGVLAVELHETTLEEAAHLATQAGYSSVRIARDLADRNRVLIARKPSAAEFTDTHLHIEEH